MQEILQIKEGTNSLGVAVKCSIYKNKYTVNIAGIIEEYPICEDNDIDIDSIYESAMTKADLLFGTKNIQASEDIEQQEIIETMLAEILLGQAEILANQYTK